jgi:SWI/SNF-related matrix-associated actin-dependent regulator of chromatin subfamily A-like protein 1
MLQVEAVMEYVEMLLENDVKLILFAHHQAVMDAYQECLLKKNVKHVRLDGDTSSLDRQYAVDAFQTDQGVAFLFDDIFAQIMSILGLL